MAFGLDDTGFTLKRLEDILTDSRANAVTIFQDLAGPDDVVDTSDSSMLGRFINLFAPSDAILWEQAQFSYSSLDPNTATGIALENIVQYGGIVRLGDTFSTVPALFQGDSGTIIPIDSVVGSSITTDTFKTTSPIILNPSLASGISVVVANVANSTVYDINYNEGVVNYTSSGSANEIEILDGLASVIASSHPLLTAVVLGNTLHIKRQDLYQTSSFSVDTSELSIVSVAKVATIKSEVAGIVTGQANTLNVIKTPVLGWRTVTNIVNVTEGSLRETDAELRLRFRGTKSERGTNTLDSLYSALNSVEGVESVAIYENDTDGTTVVIDGVTVSLPRHSFTPVILGGDGNDIAKTIWQNKPAGISSNGNTSVAIIDSQEFTHNIEFERPTPITIYIDIDLTTTSQFPGDGADLIKQAIIDYAKENFSVGKDVIYSRLYTPINSILGHEVDSLTIGTSSSPVGTSNIVIGYNEISSFESVNINISVV